MLYHKKNCDTRLVELAPELLDAVRVLAYELADRYDGAPDSPTRWMGEHLDNLQRLIAKAKGV